MLFVFPANTLGLNWLNAKIIETLVLGLDAIDADGQPEAWPNCLPNDRRDILRRRTGLRPKLRVFWEAYSDLDAASKQRVRMSISRQTALPAVFSDALPCPTSNELPDAVRQSADVLANYLFGQLNEILDGGKCLRDAHYERIHNSGIRTCPFFGLSYFRPVGAPRNALDHFMPISRYPFVGADLRNLAPACHECNSTYKGAADILSDDAVARRVCSDPYAGPTFRVSLQGSILEAGNVIRGRHMPQWIISFLDGPVPEAITWNSVYHIKSRYVATLDADFHSWIEHFARWFVRERGRGHGKAVVAQELQRYINNVMQESFEDRAFLKVEALRVVESACAAPATGNAASEWLWGFVEFAV